MGLQIKKLGYSRCPWRICWNDEEIQHLWFERKRDAKPFLAEMVSIVGECDPRQLSDESRKQVAELIRHSPSYQDWLSLVTRQATSPWL